MMKLLLGILLFVPLAAAAWRKRWAPGVIFLVGYVLFGSMFFQEWESMEDLGAFAGLLAVVLPTYAVGGAVWGAMRLLERRRRNQR
ncbi:hypothetical protein MO973_18405 [Paenibacillus sp. TRM 82003]|nr:hypothetical protein [Paenibacillus sp. TRM 82003]